MHTTFFSSLTNIAWAILAAITALPAVSVAEVSSNTLAEVTSVPINLTGNNVTPLVMLNSSRDHQLSYKAYNDYSDLDNDGTVETTYTDSIAYYGYFDSTKCYTYDTGVNRFVPAGTATGTNGHYCSGKWSGNFLNWGSMTRMDTVRKLLYGGLRSTDTATLTVLERQFLPTDAHAFAKYYAGDDVSSLTPFPNSAIGSSGTSRTIPTTATSRTFALSSSWPVAVNDYIKVYSDGNETTQWMTGQVTTVSGLTITISVPSGSYAGSGTYSNWKLKNLSNSGITLCNMTKGSDSGSNRISHTNTNPPLIRVASGNFALWAANERWQCTWANEPSWATQSSSNGNNATQSGVYAYSSDPSQTTHGLGTGSAQGEYYARVEVCKAGNIGAEKCKLYGSSYKPIGLLQVYGDTQQINFGLMTGSYAKNISGGVLRKNISSFTNEVNSADGTFTTAQGIVHNFNKIRLYGYDYNNGTYENYDDCTFQQTGFSLTSGSESMGSPALQGNCSSWGNPMSESYLESLRYLAGKTATPAFTYTGTTKDSTLGLTVATWSDPLNATNYCAQLNVLNFNASVSSYDGDQMGGVSDICTSTAAALTNTVGTYEGIDTAPWFIGSRGSDSNDLCTSKPIGAGFGAFSGLCPEAPSQQGTYLMSGLAHYANTNRIRSDLTVPVSRQNSRDLKVSTYGIALATNVPKIDIPVGTRTVTILPAYRLNYGSGGGGTLVDFKIIEKTPTRGKFYVNWEDSEMGGDYDQDMWGIIEYTVSGNTITVTTAAIAESTANPQGFGYVISGTTKDGVHFHSGIRGFNFTDPTGVTGCNNCQVASTPTSVTYTASGTTSGLLKDPLWYAAKWGGFIDNNDDKLPLDTSEWDQTNNRTGNDGSDGLPDNYFYASNPLQLESALNRVFLSILKRTSSGTAAAVVSNNVSGVGALYQAFYEPLRQDTAGNKVSWIGTVQALWLDSYGYLREDDGDAVLEGYNTDPVVQLYYDETENKTRVRRYYSTKEDEFAPYYMKGRVTAYNPATGNVTFTVDEISGGVGAGPFNNWTVYNLSTGKTGTSATSTSLSAVTDPAGSQSVTVAPLTSWFSVGNQIMIAHFESTTLALESVHTLWNARHQLSLVTDTDTQRVFNSSAGSGRYIKTWIDANRNNVVDSDEFVAFTDTSITAANFGYFNVATEAEAKNIVNYVRGKEIAGYRNRTIDYDGNGSTEVIRLGDVVNSTPTIVGAPPEGLDLLYKDASYAVFKKQYVKRRQVLYVGGNDGMLHAINGGFYDSASQSFLTSGFHYDGTTPATQHPLGSEIWAYTPMNLLPQLKWLKDNSYPHVYYMDGKPKIFDAKIFPKDLDHPGLTTDSKGWGTVLVVGMRLGGSPVTVDTAADGLATDTTPEDNRELRSAYVVFDITNPEAEPRLLAEIQVPDRSFSTSYPAVMAIKDKNAASDANKWFLSFGSGPDVLATAASNSTAKLYLFDLDELNVPGSSENPTLPAGCTRQAVGTGGNMRILSCDTGIANSFVGDPMVVDWEFDYKADNLYFGVVGDKNATSGRLMRLDTNSASSPASWTAPATVINTSQPVLAAATPAIDATNQKWIFFGTGRLYVSPDQTSTATQSIYGIKESGSTVVKTDLLNVSNAQVATNGSVTGVTGTSGAVTSFNDLKTEINNHKGWYLNLPPIQSGAGTPPATRVINSSALAGGVLFTTAYQPGLDLCTGEGVSRLYGLYYKTGTAYPSPTILGSTIISGQEIANSFVNLGQGFATTPSLHSGSGTGDNAVNVFTQLSTGTIMRTEASTVHSVRSKMESWKED